MTFAKDVEKWHRNLLKLVLEGIKLLKANPVGGPFNRENSIAGIRLAQTLSNINKFFPAKLKKE